MRIVLCGDLLFSSRNLVHRLQPELVKLLQSADAVFANAEFSTPGRDTPPGTCMYLTSVPPDILDELVDLNIRLVSMANNHIGDYGWQGAVETMAAAEARSLICCGVGRNLAEARKARFLDTAEGRVAVVATNTTWSERAMASIAGADTVARPGMSPLRWGRAYVLPEREFEQLRKIDELLGTQKSMEEVSRVETWELPDAEHIKFGSPMEGNLLIEKGDFAHVRTFVNEEDQAAILKNIRDAARRSDVVIASMHSHEGKNENWYCPEPPAFVEEFARRCIEAGATVFVGHGAHYSRGVEIYQGHPIFYNVGSLLMEFEAGESMISPEMYHTYGWPADACPSDLHSARAKKENGEWNGFYSERRFSENFLVVMDFEAEEVSYTIVPLDLDLRRKNNLHRGLPEIQTPAVAVAYAAYLQNVSAKYGTKFEYREESGTIRFYV